ncbi:MAG: TonB-dependent receptor [Candidatus Accumulibacter sp.]|nr:TonB-dependent receptor [Accumulibacter sp.]
MQIFTRKGRGPLRVHAETGFGTHDTRAVNAGFSGGRDGWSYSLQAGHRSTGGISATNRKAGGSFNPDRDRFHQTSASGGLSYTFARDQEAGLKFFHADGRSHYDGRRASDHWRDARLSSFSLYSANRLARFWTSTLRLGQSADEQSNYADGRDDGKLDTEQTQYQWQNDFQLPVGSALLAVERLEEKIDTNPVFGRDERRIDSVIAGWKANIAAHRLQFDLRRDRNSQFGGKTTGFAAYGYQFTPAWRANVSYGTAFRAPTFNDLYYPPRNGMVGNPDLEPETARNKEIAIHYEAGLHHASVTAYQNDVKNLIVWGMSPENVDAARLRGVTLAYDGALYGLDVRASADFQDPRDRGLDKVLLRRSRRHGSLSVGQRRGPFDWNLEWRLSGKRYDDRYRQRLGGYALVNVSAGYRFAPDWTAFVRANNVFDKKYALAYGYDTEGANFFVGIRYQPK